MEQEGGNENPHRNNNETHHQHTDNHPHPLQVVRTRDRFDRRPRIVRFLEDIIRNHPPIPTPTINRDNVPRPPAPPPLPPLFTEGYIRQHVATRQHKPHEPGCPTDDELCCICQDGYVSNQEIASLCCGHVYHADCIVGWLPRKNSCPLCNARAL